MLSLFFFYRSTLLTNFYFFFFFREDKMETSFFVTQKYTVNLYTLSTDSDRCLDIQRQGKPASWGRQSSSAFKHFST